MKTNAKVYVMQAPDGTIKLGHSRNPQRRRCQLGKEIALLHETDVLLRLTLPNRDLGRLTVPVTQERMALFPLRLPHEMLEQIDAIVAKGWRQSLNRSQVIRELLAQALAQRGRRK